jgi:hypothetical protein
MTRSGFYKFTGVELHYGATAVHAPNFTLLAADHETYTYPVEGWYWFDTTEDAEAFFGLNGVSNARWIEFGAAIVADPGVNQMIAAAAQNAPVLHLMLGVGLGQAAQGDARTFSTAWTAATGVGLVSPELAAHVAALATTYDLPAEFVGALNPQPEPELEPEP